MMSPRRRKLLGHKADILWCLVIVLGAHVLLDVAVDASHPDLCDLEYGVRLRMLRARLAENPHRPLLLAVGSSRIGEGFKPEFLQALPTTQGQQVLPFNFSHLAAGPIMNLLNVHRLLAEGIRPKWLVLEVMPAALCHEPASMPITEAAAGDLPLLQKYFDPWEVWSIYLRGRVNPWYKHRLGLLKEYCPSLLTQASESDIVRLETLGGDLRWLTLNTVTPGEKHLRTALVHNIYYESLQHYQVQPSCDRAMRDLLTLCQREGIAVVLLMTPEGTEFRSWYSPQARVDVDGYVAGLARDYQVPVIDTRDWAPDSDFADSHHLMTLGAVKYTLRLGQEVLEPLVEGRFSQGQRLAHLPTSVGSAN